MPSIKLANGKAVQDLRVWDGFKWVSRVGKVRTANGWEHFFKPTPNFTEAFTNRAGMTLQNAKALTKQAIAAGATSLSVSNIANFVAGQEVTITDGVNTERRRITAVGVNSLSIEPLQYSYPPNTIIARTTALLGADKATFDTRQVFTIEIT